MVSLSSTSVTDNIRSLVLDRYIDIMFIGDPSKTWLLPIWGKITDLPNVYQNRYLCGKDTMVCNLWDLPGNTDATKRMFHLDGTEESGFDYCIIVYDTITRMQRGHILKYLSIRDNIQELQHPDKKCALVVIVLKREDTWDTAYRHIVDYCKEHSIHLILMNNTKEGIDKIRNLPEQLCNIVYQDRKAVMLKKITELLKGNQ